MPPIPLKTMLRQRSATFKPSVDSPMRLITVSFGLCAILQFISFILLPISREGQEWFFWALFSAALPLLLFITLLKKTPLLEKKLPLLAVCYAFSILLQNGRQYASRILTNSRNPIFVSAPFLVFLLVAIIGVCFNYIPIAVFTKLLSEKLFPPGKNRREFITFSLIIYCFFLLNDGDLPLFWLEEQTLVSCGMFITAGALSWWAFLEKNTKAPPVPLKMNFSKMVAWLVFYFLWAFPLRMFASAGSVHHWSFYVGPVALLKRGEWLLHSIPSQYGFLSILLPGLLPFSPIDSFHWAFSGILLIQSVVVFRIFFPVMRNRYPHFTAGLLTLISVFLVAGFHAENGALSLPSTSAYRFLWVFLLAILLLRSTKPPSAIKQALICIAFATGIFWSAESAFYCVITLFTCAVAEAVCLWVDQNGKGRFKEWALRFASPVLSAAIYFLFIEVFYRYFLGVGPDWVAFVEYALTYTAGFNALNMDLGGAVNAALCFLIIVLSYMVFNVFRRLSLSAASTFGIWGAMLATFSYYVSRSHPTNICNVMAVWFPLFCLLIKQAEEEGNSEWIPLLRRVGFCLSLFLTLIAVKVPSAITGQVVSLFTLHRGGGHYPTPPRIQGFDSTF